jgi:hypothetical protein
MNLGSAPACRVPSPARLVTVPDAVDEAARACGRGWSVAPEAGGLICWLSPVDGRRCEDGFARSGVPRAERLGTSDDGGRSLRALRSAVGGSADGAGFVSTSSAARLGGTTLTLATGVLVEDEEVEERSWVVDAGAAGRPAWLANLHTRAAESSQRSQVS